MLVEAVDNLAYNSAVVAKYHHTRLDGLARVRVDLGRTLLEVLRAHLAQGAHLGVTDVAWTAAKLARLAENALEVGERGERLGRVDFEVLDDSLELGKRLDDQVLHRASHLGSRVSNLVYGGSAFHEPRRGS